MKTMCERCRKYSQENVNCSLGFPLHTSVAGGTNLCEEYEPDSEVYLDSAFGKTNKPMRVFEGGAIRDTDEGKLSYVKALSPIALRRYVQYLDQHRKQPDGSMRTFDNWKQGQGIPQEVYLDSLGRHNVAVWLICHGYKAYDNHGEVTLEDSLCGVIFNAIGMLHEILGKEVERTNSK